MRPAACVILAGGRSSRFGSDKALALLHGETLLERSLRAALGAFERVAVASKEQRGLPAGVAALADASDAQTPLAGLLAGLEWSPLEIVFSVAVDMPFAFDEALLDALFAKLGDADAALPICRGQIQPLCALWRKGPALPVARELLPLGAGPLQVAKRLSMVELRWDDERPFRDADTQADLIKLQ